MNNKRYVARSTAIAARVLGDETMVMSAVNSTLFTLDEVATVIWESADGATPLECGMVIFTVREGNCAITGAVSARSAKPNRRRSIKRP